MTEKGRLLILFTVLAAVAGCADSPDMDRAAVRINDYVFSQQEFEQELVRELEYDQTYKATARARTDFLDQVIERELLIQEAKKMGLDRDPKFVKAIETYWKATLVKLLMETKEEEVRKQITITPGDVARAYEKRLKTHGPLPPLSEIEPEMAQAALEEKRTQALASWTQELREKARIVINHAYLNQ